MRQAATKLKPADKEWGYPFGIDNLVTIENAAKALDTTKRTIWRRVKEGLLRKGKEKGRAVICKRSLDDYKASLES